MSEESSANLYNSTQTLVPPDFRELIAELREQNFDTIRFATYRAACKLRFIQKKVNLHLVDIWNVIESFRENGLNAAEPRSDVKISRIELLLSTVYHSLNKRLPAGQQIDTDKAINLLLSFLLAAYDRENIGKLRVFAVKVALATLCAGKLVDKLRYVFSQISDNSGTLDLHKFNDYLREVLALPTAVFEGPTFGYTSALINQFFDSRSKVHVNAFLDVLMADPCPACLMWLPLLHRMANVEHVFHPVVCDACGRDSFTGFRYKCQRCHNYQLCQDCFWRGRVSGAHTNQHEMKEYSSYKSPTKQLGHSISKSFRCLPNAAKPIHPAFPEQPQKQLDLANVVPSSPALLRHNGFPSAPSTLAYQQRSQGQLEKSSSVGSQGSYSPSKSYMLDGTVLDDEHKLIARYSAKLAASRHGTLQGPMMIGGLGGGALDYPGAPYLPDDVINNPRSVIATLEHRRKDRPELGAAIGGDVAERKVFWMLGVAVCRQAVRPARGYSKQPKDFAKRHYEMMREIHRLQMAQETGLGGAKSTGALPYAAYESAGIPASSGIVHELHALRSRKDELEHRMMYLQDSRETEI